MTNTITNLSTLDKDTLNEILSQVMDRSNNVKAITKKYNLDPLAMQNFLIGISIHQHSLIQYINGPLNKFARA